MRGLLTLAFTLIVLGCRCQEVSYRQFTVKDGLPGSIVYQCLQDRNGFIWFATNQGVSRFDGRTFKNFTKEDGLPDNDILKLYLDSHNDIWFVSFVGIPSVLHDNTITRFESYTSVRSICETASSDSIVFVAIDFISGISGYYKSPNKPGGWSFTPRLRRINEDFDFPILRGSSPGQLDISFTWLSLNSQQLILQDKDIQKHYTVHSNYHRASLAFGWPQYFCLSSHLDGMFFITVDSLYYADLRRISPILPLKGLGLDQIVKDDINYLFSPDDSTLWLCTRSKGMICIKDPLIPHHTIIRNFEKSFCTSIIKDQENGYWITTHSEGVYYVPNFSFYSISAFPALADKSVRCIHRLNNGKIAAGFSDGNIMLIHQPRLDASLIPPWAASNKNNRVLDIASFGPHSLMAGTDAGLYQLTPRGSYKSMIPLCSIKEAYIPSDSAIISACAGGIIIYDRAGREKKQVTWVRATCVTGLNENQLYWGSLQGMYSYQDGVILELWKKFPALSGVINHIDIAPDSAIWVSTGQGIAILKKDSVFRITKEQGLLTNLCKHISFEGNTCWVSTDKGIARVDFQWDHGALSYSLSNITEEDGLTANDVNQTVPAGKYIWAATSRGISFFSKDYVSRSVRNPLINITRLLADDSILTLKDTIFLSPKKTRLLIELSGISLRSGKAISYEYRLTQLDTSWRRITSNSIEFQSLPFGRYSLEVRAVDRWGIRSSHSNNIFIVHPTPFWETTWFVLLSYLFMALSAGAGVYLFHRYRRHKRDMDYQLKKKMQDLELMALRAQMNPHFIFNCLTSIQYHIMRSDTKSASHYLHKFSTLIRQTLQNSTFSMILLKDEIQLLTLYLDLEKLRLGDRMDYRIARSSELDPEHLLIPPMIVQPYIENAIKHGISPLEKTTGILRITFRPAGQYIECIIEDNGPGIGANRELVAPEHEYRSMGTNITRKRIDTINALNKEKIRISIVDKQQSGSRDNGTLVQLYFPIITN